MRARVAKKVLRRLIYDWKASGYRQETERRARNRSHKCLMARWGRRRTPGHRWGRWDPYMPSNPMEIPF